MTLPDMVNPSNCGEFESAGIFPPLLAPLYS